MCAKRLAEDVETDLYFRPDIIDESGVRADC